MSSSKSIEEKIEDFDKKTDQYLKQYLKNIEIIERKMTEAENAKTEEERKKLITEIERAMEYNKQFKKAAEKSLKKYKIHKQSLEESPEVHKLPTPPKRKSTNKRGGKKKKRKTKKKKAKKSKKRGGKLFSIFSKNKKTEKKIKCNHPNDLTFDEVKRELVTCGELEIRERNRAKIAEMRAKYTNPEYLRNLTTMVTTIPN